MKLEKEGPFIDDPQEFLRKIGYERERLIFWFLWDLERRVIPKKWLTLNEVMDTFGVTERMVKNWVKKRKLIMKVSKPKAWAEDQSHIVRYNFLEILNKVYQAEKY